MSLKTVRSGVERRVRRLVFHCPVSALLTGAGVLMAAGAIVRFVSGSPYSHGMMVQLGHILPSTPMMSLLWMIWYGLLGASFAATLVLARKLSPVGCAEIYRGGMLFLTMIFLGYVWYPLFFAAGHIWLATLVLLGVLALCILTAICYIRLCRMAGIVLFCHAAWLVWLCVVSVRILFC